MKRVLVIEDNPLNQRFIREVLRVGGYDPVICDDAETGLAELRRERPAIVLMDIQLPGRDGLDATREIKGDPATADIPVVAVTALAMKGDEERARAAGCDEYVTKPIDYRVLLALLDSICGGPT